MIIPTEHQEQVIIIKYCDLKRIPIFAIPNGTYKSKTNRRIMKAEGLRSGIPSINN